MGLGNKSDFHLFADCRLFEKASDDGTPKRYISGLCSTDSLDKDQEVLVQEGLDFGPFESQLGHFNLNHSQSIADIVATSNGISRYKKGEKFPDGTLCQFDNATWCEGVMLDTQKAHDIWEVGQAMQKNGKSLGFSIEGEVLKRDTKGGKKRVVAANVSAIAITQKPVNSSTSMACFAKSLQDVRDTTEKAMTVGSGEQMPQIDTPYVGEGAASLISGDFKQPKFHNLAANIRLHKPAIDEIRRQFKSISSDETAFQVLRLAQNLKDGGFLNPRRK